MLGLSYRTAIAKKGTALTGSLSGTDTTIFTQTEVHQKPRLVKNDDSLNAPFGGSTSSGGGGKTACSPGKDYGGKSS
jgi:hypothetical protein